MAYAYPADCAEKYWVVSKVDIEWMLNPGPPLVRAITRSKSFSPPMRFKMVDEEIGGFIIYGKYVLKSGQIDHHSHAHKLQEIDPHNDPIDRVLVRAVLTLAS